MGNSHHSSRHNSIHASKEASHSITPTSTNSGSFHRRESKVIHFKVDHLITQWHHSSRPNLKGVLDCDLVYRLYALIAPDGDDGDPHLLLGLLHFAIAQKLLKSLPKAKNIPMSHLDHLLHYHPNLPNVAYQAIDSLGAFREGEFNYELIGHQHLILNQLMKTVQHIIQCKVEEVRSVGVCNMDPFKDCSVDRYIFRCQGSADMVAYWANAELRKLMHVGFQIGDVEAVVSYPGLDLNGRDAELEENVERWLQNMSPKLPHGMKAACLSLMMFCQESWLFKPASTLQSYFAWDLPDWLQDATVQDGLRHLELELVLNGRDVSLDVENDIHFNFFQAIDLLLPLLSLPLPVTLFANDCHLVKTKFSDKGNAAQLIQLSGNSYVSLPTPPPFKGNYRGIRGDARVRNAFMVKDKRLVGIGMALGLMKQVELHQVYESTFNQSH